MSGERRAFPVGDVRVGQEGMSLREWYAGMALLGFLSGRNGRAVVLDGLADEAFRLADQMAERAERK